MPVEILIMRTLEGRKKKRKREKINFRSFKLSLFLVESFLPLQCKTKYFPETLLITFFSQYLLLNTVILGENVEQRRTAILYLNLPQF